MSADPTTAPRGHHAEVAARAPVLAIVGAGAAGTLSAIHLLRELRRRRIPATVVLIDPAAEVGRGVAYSTTDERHLLNVPVGSLSALPEDPDHLLDWTRARLDPAPAATDYLPRRLYGRYLADTLETDAVRAGSPPMLRRFARAAALEPVQGGGHRLHLTDGTTLVADSVVIASGITAPGTAWAPKCLLRSARFVPDPWAPGALDAVARPRDDVLLVGTGLTMTDVALTVAREGRTVHAVSRRGRLPKAHSERDVPAVEPTDLPEDAGLSALRQIVHAHLSATVREHGDWRPGMDGLRPHTARLWSGLSEDSRAEFVARDAGGWDVHRHRMPVRTATAIGRLLSTGALRIATGEVRAATDDGGSLLVALSDGTSHRVGYVVNCTGPLADVTLSGDPLLDQLLADGLAVPGPVRMGLATDQDGRVRAADGSVGALWTLGAMRRGELWESTAIPEIRAQAAALARHVVTSMAPHPRTSPAVNPPLRRGGPQRRARSVASP